MSDLEQQIGSALSNSELAGYICSILENERPVSAAACVELLSDYLISFDEAQDDQQCADLCDKLFQMFRNSINPEEEEASSNSTPQLLNGVRLSDQISAAEQSDLSHIGLLNKTTESQDSRTKGNLDFERDVLMVAAKMQQMRAQAECSDEKFAMRVPNLFALARKGVENAETLRRLIFADDAWRPSTLRLVADAPESNDANAASSKGKSADDDGEEHVDLGLCEMCERELPLTRHHLIPKETHDRYVKQGFQRSFLLHHVIEICRPCHSSVHTFADGMTLAHDYNTLAKLMANEQVLSFVEYHAKQKVRIKAPTGPKR
jgi:hypothetical protein